MINDYKCYRSELTSGLCAIQCTTNNSYVGSMLVRLLKISHSAAAVSNHATKEVVLADLCRHTHHKKVRSFVTMNLILLSWCWSSSNHTHILSLLFESKNFRVKQLHGSFMSEGHQNQFYQPLLNFDQCLSFSNIK